MKINVICAVSAVKGSYIHVFSSSRYIFKSRFKGKMWKFEFNLVNQG